MNRNDFDSLIVRLLAIANYAKDIHYNCTGANFYGNHLLADRFIYNIYKYIDQIKEVCLLGHNYAPLRSSEYLKAASEIIPIDIDFRMMRSLMIDTLALIDEIKNIFRSDENLIGTIAQDIQNNVGLINIMYGDMRE